MKPRAAGRVFDVPIPLTTRGVFEGICGEDVFPDVWRPQRDSERTGGAIFGLREVSRVLRIAA